MSKCKNCGLEQIELEGFKKSQVTALAATVCTCPKSARWLIVARKAADAERFADLMGIDVKDWLLVQKPAQLAGLEGTVVILASAARLGNAKEIRAAIAKSKNKLTELSNLHHRRRGE